MKEKTVEIHIRVSENEKKKLQKNAKKSGLSLSSYLRKVGLKKEIYPIPDKEFYKIYIDICTLKTNIYKLEKDKIIENLEQILKEFLDIYYSKSNGDDDNGDNKNMGN